MKIKIITKQIYDEHEETTEQVYEDASIIFENSKVTISYGEEKIIVNEKEKTLEILRDKNNIFIQQNEEKSLNYETPYGKIDLVTIGEKMFISHEPFSLIFEYKIIMNQQINYKNIIEIIKA